MKFFMSICIAAVSMASVAHATTTTLVFRGKVLSGTDVIGSFGFRNADLSGKSYEAEYKIDYDSPGNYYRTSDQYYVGSSNPSTNPVVTSVLTIDGVNLYNAGNGGSFASLVDGAVSPFGNDEIFPWTQAFGSNMVNQLVFDVRSSQENFVKSPDFGLPFLYYAKNAISSGYLYMYGFDPDDTSVFFTTYLNLEITSVQLGSISAVPDSSTWALMIAGFAITGGVMRRRRINSVTALG